MKSNLQTRLIAAFVALTAVPLLLLGGLLGLRTFPVQRAQALAQQREVSLRLSAAVESFIREREAELRLLSEVRGLQNMGSEERNRVLEGLLSYQNVYEEVVLLDGQGVEQARFSRFEVTAADDLVSREDQPEYVQPLLTGETYFGPVIFDEVSGEPSMTIALPLIDLRSGALEGVLAAQFRFKTVWDLVAAAGGEGGVVYVVDAEGRVVAHRNPSIVLQGTQFGVPEDGFVVGLNGERAALASSRVTLGEQSFDVVSETPSREALALANSTAWITAIALVVSIGIAGGLGVLAALQVTRPIDALVATAQAVAGGDLYERAEVTTRDEIGELAAAVNEMTDQLQRTLSGLEQRIAARTEVLEASVDVSRATTSLLDPDVLVRQVVGLVRERFDLYYVGLFLVDEEERFAVLRAGTGEAGQEMLSRGHRLGVGGDSMIGQCISGDAARIALDVGEEAVRFENPLLPDTRSELALPMRSRGRVVGAMTVQSAEESAFDAAYVNVLQAMADQIAVAIDNARLYAESDAARAALEAAQRRYVGQAWIEYLRQRTVAGYRDTGAGIRPIEEEVLPEALRAMGQDGFVIGDNASLSAPIIDRGRTIGALGFADTGEDDQGRPWSEDELEILEAVRTQFAQVADNLRLLDQTQRGQAREQAIGQVTSSIRQSLEIDDVLRTAAEQIRETLGLGKAVVRLAMPEEVSDRADNE